MIGGGERCCVSSNDLQAESANADLKIKSDNCLILNYLGAESDFCNLGSESVFDERQREGGNVLIQLKTLEQKQLFLTLEQSQSKIF